MTQVGDPLIPPDSYVSPQANNPAEPSPTN